MGILDLVDAFTESFCADVPVYLVKRKVESKWLAFMSHFGADSTHWMLQVRGNYYHLRVTRKKNVVLDTTPVEGTKVTYKSQIARTRMGHQRIMREGRRTLDRYGKYRLLSNNCQDFAHMLAVQIAPGPDYINDFKDVFRQVGLIEGTETVGRTKYGKIRSIT